jgi:DNA invertase Pin-like site-specific DNA recombinase
MENSLLVGYSRVSTDTQDLTAQRNALSALGMTDDRICSDQGMTGMNRDRPGLREALAACRAGDTFIVTKLDQLARSLRDATDIVEDLTRRDVRVHIGGTIYDPSDPVGRLLFHVLGIIAEFEGDLIRARTREGMRIARARGKLKGRRPKLSPAQERLVLKLRDTDKYSVAEICELFGVARAPVYRSLERARFQAEEPSS